MAMTGSLFAGKCYDPPALAQDAYYASVPPLQVPVTGGAYTHSFVYSGGAWKHSSQYYPNTGNPTGPVLTNPPMPPLMTACDPTVGLSDGFAIGWLLAAILISVAALNFIRRGIA